MPTELEHAIDRLIGESQCELLTSLSRTTRWRLMRNGDFPRKIRISPNRTGWRFSEILTWLHDREAA